MNQSQTAVLPFGQSDVPDDVEIHSACERACCTISTKTFRVSAGLFTSRKNAMRAPRMPSRVNQWAFPQRPNWLTANGSRKSSNGQRWGEGGRVNRQPEEEEA